MSVKLCGAAAGGAYTTEETGGPVLPVNGSEWGGMRLHLERKR